MAARSSVELTSVVGRSRPFQRALEAGTKFVPRTVSEKPGASGIVSVPPPVVAVTQSWFAALNASR